MTLEELIHILIKANQMAKQREFSWDIRGNPIPEIFPPHSVPPEPPRMPSPQTVGPDGRIQDVTDLGFPWNTRRNPLPEAGIPPHRIPEPDTFTFPQQEQPRLFLRPADLWR